MDINELEFLARKAANEGNDKSQRTIGNSFLSLIDRLREAEAECERLREDARRYRWIRGSVPHSTRWTKWRIEIFTGIWEPMCGYEMDTAIDAARAQEQSYER